MMFCIPACRNLEEIMAERKVRVDHVTIWRWIQRYPPEHSRQQIVRRRVGYWLLCAYRNPAPGEQFQRRRQYRRDAQRRQYSCRIPQRSELAQENRHHR